MHSVRQLYSRPLSTGQGPALVPRTTIAPRRLAQQHSAAAPYSQLSHDRRQVLRSLLLLGSTTRIATSSSPANASSAAAVQEAPTEQVQEPVKLDLAESPPTHIQATGRIVAGKQSHECEVVLTRSLSSYHYLLWNLLVGLLLPRDIITFFCSWRLTRRLEQGH